jgi:hypothetical protein
LRVHRLTLASKEHQPQTREVGLLSVNLACVLVLS